MTVYSVAGLGMTMDGIPWWTDRHKKVDNNLIAFHLAWNSNNKNTHQNNKWETKNKKWRDPNNSKQFLKKRSF